MITKGSRRNGQPIFINTDKTYFLDRIPFFTKVFDEFWLQELLRKNPDILPIKESGQLKYVKEGDKLSDNFEIIYVNGHTDAMMIPQIKYKDRVVVFMADLLPSAGHIPLPYVMAYDMFPMTTLQEKKIFLHEAMEEKYILFFEHDPVIECCDLIQTERGVRSGDNFKVEDI